MSYAYNPPGATTLDQSTWQQRKPHAQNSVAGKINNIISGKDNNGLPMYKDKPYNYSPTAKKPAFYRQRRLMLGLFALLVWILYWTGAFSKHEEHLDHPNKPWWAETKSTKTSKKSVQLWNERREKVRDAYRISWKAYEEHAWGHDIFHPASKTADQMVPNGMGWIIIDALDTMMLMNLTTELSHARDWVATNLTFEQDHDVNTFETTIRMLGGLLSAHYLSTEFPNLAPLPAADVAAGEDLYLEKATDLADRLLGAYESNSGVPFASINLKTAKGIPSHDDGGASSTAEATSLQLEMKYLAKLTGETHYWEAAEKVMQVVDNNGAREGLLPIFVYADSGTFRGEQIRLGSRGDSYYEYLIKQYLQTSLQEPIYNAMWSEALHGIRKHLLAYTKHTNLTILGELPQGLDGPLFPKMDHLVCFLPGTIALAATGGHTLAHARSLPTWTADHDAQMELAKDLTKTCWGMYKVTATGLSPEIAHFHMTDPVVLTASETTPRTSPEELSTNPAAEWRKDFDIHHGDVHNLQRPETVETLFYMWRITGDEKYREWGWEMFESFLQWTLLEETDFGHGDDDATAIEKAKVRAEVMKFGGEKKYRGFSSINDVNQTPPPTKDNMESFWLAETLKYFYLLFSPSDILPLTDIVLNTEAHPFPRFEMGKLFKTGWQRKPRDANGRIVTQQTQNHGDTVHVEKKNEGVVESVRDEVKGTVEGVKYEIKEVVKDGKEGLLGKARDDGVAGGDGKKVEVTDVVPAAVKDATSSL